MLLIVLTYIALNQTALQGLVTIFIYAVGLSIPLIILSSIGGTIGKRLKEYSRTGGDLFDRIIGIGIILMGIFFLYLAFR